MESNIRENCKDFLTALVRNPTFLCKEVRSHLGLAIPNFNYEKFDKAIHIQSDREKERLRQLRGELKREEYSRKAKQLRKKIRLGNLKFKGIKRTEKYADYRWCFKVSNSEFSWFVQKTQEEIIELLDLLEQRGADSEAIQLWTRFVDCLSSFEFLFLIRKLVRCFREGQQQPVKMQLNTIRDFFEYVFNDEGFRMQDKIESFASYARADKD